MFNLLKKPSVASKPKTLGQLGEERAQEEYKKLGFKIIEANFYNTKGKRLGEIDFIAELGQKIVFVEVKTRTFGPNKFGGGAESVNLFKQLKILKAVKIFLLNNRKYSDFQPQIDVCLLEYSEVDKTFKPAKIISNAVEDWN